MEIKKSFTFYILCVLNISTLFLILYFIKYSDYGTQTIIYPKNETKIPKYMIKLDKYKTIHDDIINSYRKNSSSRISIVLYEDLSHLGYANRIYGLVNSMLVAVLTDSALLIDWKTIHGLIEPPLKYSFDFGNFFGISAQPSESIINMPYDNKNTWKLVKSLNMLLTAEIPIKNYKNKTIYKIGSNAAYFLDICSNPKYYKKLLEYDLINPETIKEAEKRLKEYKLQKANINKQTTKIIHDYNPDVMLVDVNEYDINLKTQDALLMIGYQVGGNLLRKFWIPTPSIQHEIELYKAGYEFDKSFVIGMHLRFEYLNFQDIYSFIACALQIENELIKSKNNIRIKWFVASDSQANILKMKEIYPDKVIMSDGLLAHVAENSNGFKRTIVDNELLSECDEIILTGGSTFGFVAALKQKKHYKMPYYVNGKRNEINKCQRMRLALPPKTGHNTASFK